MKERKNFNKNKFKTVHPKIMKSLKMKNFYKNLPKNYKKNSIKK